MNEILDAFIELHINKFVEYHSYDPEAKNQCVDLANEWLDKGLGLPAIIGTNAIDFPDKAMGIDGMEWIINTTDGVPDPGDLVVYDGKYGHIDIAIEGCTSTKLRTFSQNYPTGSPCIIRESNYLKPKVIGWIHPTKGNMTQSDELTSCLLDREKFWKERDQLLATIPATDVDNATKVIGGYKSEVTTIKGKLEDAQKLAGEAQGELINLQAGYTRLKEEIAIQETNLKTATDQSNDWKLKFEEASKAQAPLNNEIQTLKIANASLKDQIINQVVIITFKEAISLLINGKLTIKKG